MGWPQETAGVLRACLEEFQDTDTNGAPRLVNYRPAGAAAFDVRAIFRAAHVQVDGPDGTAMSSVQPRLGLILAELATAPREGDEVVVRDVLYRVQDAQPDGEGGVELVIQRIGTP